MNNFFWGSFNGRERGGRLHFKGTRDSRVVCMRCQGSHTIGYRIREHTN